MKSPSSKLTRREAIVLSCVAAILVSCSLWQNYRLQYAQLLEKQALYAERLRTTQTIIESEMLAAAYLTTLDARTRERARYYFERSPR
jgi:hypothetical protein